MPKAGLSFLIKGASKITAQLAGIRIVTQRASSRSAKAVGRLLFAAVKQNVSLTDHSLDDLRRLGFPYRSISPVIIHRPRYAVHKQDGDLESAIIQVISKTSKGRKVSIEVDESVAPHARHVILGTSRMVARDFLTGSLRASREEMFNIVELDLNKSLGKFFD